MILVTDEPTEGIAFDAQDHARRTGTIWTCTHGEMITSDLHGSKEPTRWMLIPIRGQRQDTNGSGALHWRRRERFTKGTPTKLELGGMTLS
jgi:hypothetical protein